MLDEANLSISRGRSFQVYSPTQSVYFLGLWLRLFAFSGGDLSGGENLYFLRDGP